jgi:hypothetical protein
MKAGKSTDRWKAKAAEKAIRDDDGDEEGVKVTEKTKVKALVDDDEDEDEGDRPSLADIKGKAVIKMEEQHEEIEEGEAPPTDEVDYEFDFYYDEEEDDYDEAFFGLTIFGFNIFKYMTLFIYSSFYSCYI